MTAYYNEIDPKAAAWLRELIKQGHIADGVVDERSIVDVTPDELREFTQCHFFAGIGVWSYALRSAGWSDDRPVWTGSCPCQPFSSAGKGHGVADERHLWPHWHHLISQCQPSVVFGEQVASKDGLGWLDLVSADMEATGYAFGASDLCAAGVGAPHIRQRLFFGSVRMADASGWRQRGSVVEKDRGQRQHRASSGAGWLADMHGNGCNQRRCSKSEKRCDGFVRNCTAFGVADADGGQRGRIADGEGRQRYGAPTGRQQGDREPERGGAGMRMEYPSGDGRQQWRAEPSGWGVASGCSDGGLADASDDGSQGRLSWRQDAGREAVNGSAGCGGADSWPSQTNVHWRDADWLYCRDGKWRPVEPGTFPLAHGSAQRVGRLRGYGNAIVAKVAQTFIESMMEIMDDV